MYLSKMETYRIKKAILFKTLVDTLYILHFMGLIGVLLILPIGLLDSSGKEFSDEKSEFFLSTIFLLRLIAYIIFLRGLFYLRKMARHLLSNQFFSEKIIHNLNRTGFHFFYAGILSLAILILTWVSKLMGGKLELTYDNNLMIPLFLTIVGVFFLIQSHSLKIAKDLKEENELTV